MYENKLESIMLKYLEHRENKEEAQMVLDHLMESERERHIINLAAAGLRCMHQTIDKLKIKQYDSRH